MKLKKYFIYVFMPVLLLSNVVLCALAFSVYKNHMKDMTQDYNNKVLALQKQISGLQGQVTDVTNQNAATALSTKELENRQAVEEQGTQKNVTNTVSKVIPAVVSVIISKNVPQYQIQYENPFGDDPFFQNFGAQIPVYVPTGTTKPQEVGAGSGFIITSNGYILTNKHVVSDSAASYTVLLSTGKQETAKVVYRDPTNDIAVIKIDGTNFPTVSLGSSESMELGETVIAIGNALGQYNNSVSMGIISGLNRTIEASDQSTGASETLNGVIQTDAAINPGNSGGPLVDLSGNVIGINVATVQGSNNISFSIPINIVKNAIKSVVNL